MTNKTLFKLGLFLIALTSAIGIYLALQLVARGSLNAAQAQAATCQNGTVKNPFDATQCFPANDPRLSAKCRYKSGGGSCAPAQFLPGTYDNLAIGEMAFCNGGRVLYIDKNDQGFPAVGGYTYMESVNKGSIRCLQNGITPDKACDGKNDLVMGEGTTCSNPYKCAPKSTPTPQPKAKVVIKAVCDNSINLTGDLSVDFVISRGGQNNVIARGKTEQEVEVPGLDRIDIFTGKLPQSVTNKYPNISPKNEQSFIGKVVASDRAIVYEFSYNNCTPAPTATPTRIVQTVTPTPTTPSKNPNVSISKTVVGTTTIAQNAKVRFNITVKNTGDVDLTTFNLFDEFDPTYIKFDSAKYKGVTIDPQVENVNGRTRLVWLNLPPKSGVPNEDGVLNINEEFVLNLEFTLIKQFDGDPGAANDNCGVVTTIGYKNADNAVRSSDVNLKSCAEFFSEKKTQLTVETTKSFISGTTTLQDVKFRAVIRNNSDRAYSDIDFTDEYDSKALKLKSVSITKGNVTTDVKCYASTTPLVINDLQDLKQCGTTLGGLQKGESYQIDITYTAQIATTATCDVVTGNVSDGTDRVSSKAQACTTTITAPNPPETGANFILNFIVPMLTLAATTVGRVIVKNYA